MNLRTDTFETYGDDIRNAAVHACVVRLALTASALLFASALVSIDSLHVPAGSVVQAGVMPWASLIISLSYHNCFLPFNVE